MSEYQGRRRSQDNNRAATSNYEGARQWNPIMVANGRIVPNTQPSGLAGINQGA